MDNIKVSIIIPVYNAEKYLNQCLDSITNQTFKDIEIIAVNDCSTDNSLNILKDFESKDNRIKIIDLKENKGISNARNSGFNLARGEYVYFIDSDDWLDLNYIELMVSKIEELNANVLININFIEEHENKTSQVFNKFNYIKTNYQCIDSKKIQREFPPVVWLRLYRKSFLEKYKISFPPIPAGAEDVYFTYACDLIQKDSYIFKGSYYHFFRHNSSIMHKKERGYYYIESFKVLYDFLNKNNINLDNIKLFFVESLIIDNIEKFNFIKKYLEEIEQQFKQNINIYNEQEIFLFNIIKESTNYETFKSKYNPNISISFLRNKMFKK